MRKKICIVLAVLMVISTNICSFANDSSEQNIDMYYIGTSSYSSSFSLVENNVAMAKTMLMPKSTTALDKVLITIKVTQIATDKVIYNQTKSTSYDRIFDRFEYSAQIKLPAKGRYQMTATFKCYKGEKLIETLKSDSRILTY